LIKSGLQPSMHLLLHVL